MADISREIEQRIHEFLGELNGLVRQAAVQAVADALGGEAQPARPAPAAARPAPAPAKATPKPTAATAGGGKRKPGEKRPQAELARVRELLAKYITSTPGQRIEHIGQALAMPTADLTRPLNKLLAAGTVKKTGDRRATRYYPGGGEAKESAAKKQPAKKAPAKPDTAAKPAPTRVAKKKAAKKK